MISSNRFTSHISVLVYVSIDSHSSMAAIRTNAAPTIKQWFLLNENFTSRTTFVKTLERTWFSDQPTFTKGSAKSKRVPSWARMSACLPKIENQQKPS